MKNLLTNGCKRMNIILLLFVVFTVNIYAQETKKEVLAKNSTSNNFLAINNFNISSYLGENAIISDQGGTEGDSTAPFTKISLHKSFWKGLQFTHKNNEKKGIFGFTGLSFNPEFKEIISTNPFAYDEANKSFLYNGIALAGSIGMMAVSFKYLLDTIDQAKEVSRGDMYAKDPEFNFTVFIISAAVSGISSYISKTCIEKSVKIYNN